MILSISIVLVGCGSNQESYEESQKPSTTNAEEGKKTTENATFIYTANESGSISKLTHLQMKS